MDQHSVKCLVFICQKTSLDWQKLNMLPYSIRLKIKEGGVQLPQLEPHCVNMNFASVGSRFAPGAPSGNHPEGFSLIKSFPDLFGKVEDPGLNINHYNFIKKREVSPHFQPSSYCGGSELCISSGRSAAVPVIGALPDLPNLKAYFHAAQIKPLVYCPARWNDIEHSTLKDPPTQASLAHTHLDVHVNMIPNPRIKMKIWDKVKEES